MTIKRKTKNPNPEFLVFLFVEVEGLVGCGVGKGEVLTGEWKQLFSCDTMYQPNIALNFHQDIP